MNSSVQCNKKRLFCCVRSFCRRIVSLLLILVLLPCCLAVPAHAAEIPEDNTWINVLDYGVSNLGSNNFTVRSGDRITYSLPGYVNVKRVDMVFSITYSSVDLDFQFDIGTIQNADIISLGNGLYRASLTCNAGGNSISFYPTFGSSGKVIFDVMSFRVSSVSVESYPINVIFGGYNGADGVFTDMHFTNSGSIHQDFYIDSDNAAWNGGYFTCLFSFNEDWQKYDYIDLVMSYGFGKLASFSCSLDGVNIPVTVSPIYPNIEQPTDYNFTVRLDLTGVDRTSSSYPVLKIDGKGIAGSNQFYLYSAYGFIQIEQPSLWSYWFTKVSGWLSSGFNSVVSGLQMIDTYLGTNLAAQTEALVADIGGFISDQTTSINTSILNFQSRMGTWLNGLTQTLKDYIIANTNAVVSWGGSIVDSIGFGVDRIVDAITGGENADDLKNGADQIGEAGSSLGSNIGSIQDFEDQYFGQLDTNMDSLISAGNISGIVAPLAFVQRYTNMIVSGIPSNFLVIFTLPILLGIFMFMVNHRIKVPRPDRSGDSVTHEVGGRSNDSNR